MKKILEGKTIINIKLKFEKWQFYSKKKTRKEVCPHS